MEFRPVKLLKCKLNLGQIHQGLDFGFFHPEFTCQTEEGDVFVAKMRLHITEPLDPLIIADPRCFRDLGVVANSVNSPIFDRKQDYAEQNKKRVSFPESLAGHFRFYSITVEQIKECLIQNYNFECELRQLHESGRKPRIAFTLHDPGVVGGGNTIVFRIISWLLELGYEVTAYTCSGRYPYWKKLNNLKIKQFRTYEEMCASIEEEIVILFTMWHIEPMMLSKPNGKLVLHYRQTLESRNYGFDPQSMDAKKPVIDLLESLPIGYFAVSPHLQQCYTSLVGKPGWLITNGINLKDFYPPLEQKASKVSIFSVGNPLYLNKNADTLAEALKIVAQQHTKEKIEWHIASGDLAEYDPYHIAQSNISIYLHRNLTPREMCAFYQSTTVFVNPSLYEGFGLPTLEALACGVPVVSADNRGLDGVLEDGVDCLFVPPKDAQKMAEAICRFIDQPDLRKQFAQAGLKRVEELSVAGQYSLFVTAFHALLGDDFPTEQANEKEKQMHMDQEAKVIDSLLQRRPLVSVVIPSYNQAEYLKEALQSLFEQTYDNWEAVVVNDGSTDHTAQVIEEYTQKDKRVRGFTQPNGGITSALNEGLKQARGEFFCWLSSDDLFYPRKLESQLRAFDTLDEEYGLVYGSFDLLNQETGKVEEQGFMPPITPGAEFPEALKFDFIDGCTIMIRMNVMREVNGFNPNYRHAQDTELWMRIASRGYRFHILPEKMTIRRIHPAQSSTANMIHCRHDHACMINFYLERYHLLEVYRYFDLSNTKRRAEFVNHLASRTFHTEAGINHPLIMEKFWNWINTGLQPLHPDVQRDILLGLESAFRANVGATPKMQFYLARCETASKEIRKQEFKEFNYAPEGRDMRAIDRSQDPFMHAFFDYGGELLVNVNTPMVGQELFFHDTNKVVEGPLRLGHSVFRYLSQFKNPYQERVKPYAGLDAIPKNAAEAVMLFTHMRYPMLAEAFCTSIEYRLSGNGNETQATEAEKQIAAMPDYYQADMERYLAHQPTERILYFWHRLTQDPQANYQAVIEETMKSPRIAPDMAKISVSLKDWVISKLHKSKKYFKNTRLILPKTLDMMIHFLIMIRKRLD